jgi:hypothetical protein
LASQGPGGVIIGQFRYAWPERKAGIHQRIILFRMWIV